MTVTVEDELLPGQQSTESSVEVEVINDIILSSRETRTVRVSRMIFIEPLFILSRSYQIPLTIKARRPGSLIIEHLNYDFVSLLPSVESLSSRGRRLQDTALQRQHPTYAPDVPIRVQVAEASHKLIINFVDDQRLVLARGEVKQMRLWFSNAGTRPIGELWMVAGPEDEVWVEFETDENEDEDEDEEDEDEDEDEGEEKEKEEMTEPKSTPSKEILHSDNSLTPRMPLRVPLSPSNGSPTLAPGETMEVTVLLHADRLGEQELSLLFVYREVSIFFVFADCYSFPNSRFAMIDRHRGISPNSSHSILRSRAYVRDFGLCPALPFIRPSIPPESRYREYFFVKCCPVDAIYYSEPDLGMYTGRRTGYVSISKYILSFLQQKIDKKPVDLPFYHHNMRICFLAHRDGMADLDLWRRPSSLPENSKMSFTGTS